jgi:phosphomannomutase
LNREPEAPYLFFSHNRREFIMSNLIVSVSGLRGIVGESLTPELAARFACAYAGGCDAGPLVLARDGRATGPMLCDAICGSLAAVGRTVLMAGVAATPTVGVLVRRHHAAGAIQVSASHNPPEYNGIKLFAKDGQVLPAAAGQQVVKRFEEHDPAWVDYRGIGQVQWMDDTTSEHIKTVMETVDVDRIRQRQFPVLLDSNHGAGSVMGQRLLEFLGCDVTAVGDTPDGLFAHPPEPTADNLAEVCEQVVGAKAMVGFCQDPDADRLAIIDEQGRYVGEEYTLAMCLNHILQTRKGPVVINCATSRMSEDLAERYGVTLLRSPVGEANVVEVMKREKAVFGGEGNGGPIDPRVGYIRDSFVGMALILDAMAARDVPVSTLADELPRYEIHKTKQPLEPAKLSEALTRLEEHFADATVNRADGLRLDWPGRWLLIRASNTEPIVRIIAETSSRNQSVQLCREAAEVLK